LYDRWCASFVIVPQQIFESYDRREWLVLDDIDEAQMIVIGVRIGSSEHPVAEVVALVRSPNAAAPRPIVNEGRERTDPTEVLPRIVIKRPFHVLVGAVRR
jgi:hypothetical protein